jgi:hypothetical protein
LCELLCPIVGNAKAFGGEHRPRTCAAKLATAHQALLVWQRITMIFAGSEGIFRHF